MPQALSATPDSALARQPQVDTHFWRHPAFVWAWTNRINLLKVLFSAIVFAWSFPPITRALASPHFLKCLLLLLLFAVFVIRKAITFKAKQLSSTKEPTQ